MPLNKFQTEFKDLMLDHPNAVNKPPEIVSNALVSDHIALPERLKVYRNNIVGSLTDVMLAAFPLCEKLVGKEFLEGMARSFILENPPNAGCLNTFGRGFAEFIESFEPAKSLPYLPDMARLEIALNDSYYAADDSPLTPQGLSTLPPENLDYVKLNLREGRILVSSKYPLLALREFCLTGENPPDLNAGGENLLILRPHLDTEILKLDDASYAFLTQIEQKNPLGEALEHTINTHENFDFNEFLQTHIKLETFQALATNN